MRVWGHGFRSAMMSVGVLTICSLLSSTALAALPQDASANTHKTIKTAAKSTVKPVLVKLKTQAPVVRVMAVTASSHSTTITKQSLLKGGKAQYASRTPRLQCVPFARAASGIELKGNAANWWDAAAGVYARGQAPEAGSVLNFRATRGMRLGHVAVVTQVVSSREIIIDHANWAGPGANKGGVARGISVIDVSADNSWSQVRVALGNENYGSVYPTYGFIYDRPDNGVFAANAGAQRLDEVAEAPSRSYFTAASH